MIFTTWRAEPSSQTRPVHELAHHGAGDSSCTAHDLVDERLRLAQDPFDGRDDRSPEVIEKLPHLREDGVYPELSGEEVERQHDADLEAVDDLTRHGGHVSLGRRLHRVEDRIEEAFEVRQVRGDELE